MLIYGRPSSPSSARGTACFESVAACVFPLLLLATSAFATQKTAALSPADIFHQAHASVVLIVGSGGDKEAQGSGFIVAKDRIVTNYHVIAGLSSVYVLFADGRGEPVAGVVTADADQDIAVLEAPTGHHSALALGDEMNLHEGESVLAIGAPRGLELTISSGIVSAFRNSEKRFLIQNTASIAPGSSGGPLLDSHGRVVGVTTSLLADTPGIYFSIGVGAVKRELKASQSTLIQPFAEWAASKDVRPSPNLKETFEWIKNKVETKGGGTTYYETPANDPSEAGEEQHYGLELRQSSDDCVFLLRMKRKLITRGVASSLFGQEGVGCLSTTEEDYSDTLPMYYLREAKSITLNPYGHQEYPAVNLKFDGKKQTMHWDRRVGPRTECRDTSLNTSPSMSPSSPDTQEMRTDFELINFFRYPTEDNEDLAKRVAAAFNHVAQLCAKQRPVSKEPF